jgi:hypothetical protein
MIEYHKPFLNSIKSNLSKLEIKTPSGFFGNVQNIELSLFKSEKIIIKSISKLRVF